MSFIKAEWRKLVLANYRINPILLKQYIPQHTEIDLWNGQCYISLVGFMFMNTKLLGLKIPYHTDFEEVNLRFYVRHKEGNEWKRGVVFIKELVPRFAISLIANSLYKEHYHTVQMKHSIKEQNDILEVQYQWKTKSNWQHIHVQADATPIDIPVGSETEFITEHFWGYTKFNQHLTSEYHVTHPRWKIYNIQRFNIQVDFGLEYGNDFSFLTNMKPASIMLAEGSEITVEGKRMLV